MKSNLRALGQEGKNDGTQSRLTKAKNDAQGNKGTFRAFTLEL